MCDNHKKMTLEKEMNVKIEITFFLKSLKTYEVINWYRVMNRVIFPYSVIRILISIIISGFGSN